MNYEHEGRYDLHETRHETRRRMRGDGEWCRERASPSDATVEARLCKPSGRRARVRTSPSCGRGLRPERVCVILHLRVH